MNPIPLIQIPGRPQPPPQSQVITGVSDDGIAIMLKIHVDSVGEIMTLLSDEGCAQVIEHLQHSKDAAAKKRMELNMQAAIRVGVRESVIF